MFVSALALSLLPVVALANPQYGGYGGGGSSPSSSAAASAAAASTSADAGRTIVSSNYYCKESELLLNGPRFLR